MQLGNRTETEGEPREAGTSTRVSPQLYLLLEGGRPCAGGLRHALVHVDEVVLGRRAERAARRVVEGGLKKLYLEVPDARMSQEHARIVEKSGAWVLEDAGSRNGSRVNGAVVKSHELRDSDTIELGRTVFYFREAAVAPIDAPGDVEPKDLAGEPRGFATLIAVEAARARALASLSSRSNTSILLLGESGTGKEVLAQSIHQLSGRTGKLVAVNCGALSDGLVESQFFGHVKGAFSGAVKDEPGFVRRAHEGTLFLDEIGDLPLASQAALLRVLQEREVVPVGASDPVSVDVRIISATHAPIEECVEQGLFRSDLYARLAGYTHRLIPLRERREDLGLLVAALLTKLLEPGKEAAPIAYDALRAMLEYEWPRNVRELEQALSVALVLAEGGELQRAHLPEAIAKPKPAKRSIDEESELRALLAEKLKEHRGNITHVANAMGKARMQIQRWIKRFDLDPDTFKK